MFSKTARLALALFLLLPPQAGVAASPAPAREFRVNASPLAAHAAPSVAVFPDGGFVVVWTVSPRDGHRVIHARLYGRDGMPASGELRLIDRNPGSQQADRVAADKDGSFLLVSTEQASLSGKSEVFVRRFNRDGTPRAARFRVHPASASNRFDGVLAIGRAGRIAVAWTADVILDPLNLSYSDARARIFTASGTALSPEFLVAAGFSGFGDDNEYAFSSALALAPDGTLTALSQIFISPGGMTTVLLRRPGNGSAPTRDELNPPSLPFPSPGAGLAMGRNGSLVAVWSAYDVAARKYAPSGAPVGSEIVVSRRRPNDPQYYPVVALLPGGGFVVVWTETGPRDGSDWGLYGRTFAADGTPLSNDFRVNTTTAGFQYGPAVAAGVKGPVVVVWNQRSESGKYDVFARVLFPATP